MERTNQPLTNEAARKLMALDVQDKEILTYEKLDEWYTAWGGQCYVSFSGGKDSTVLAYLAARYLSSFRTPPWELNLVFVNTGLEYPEIQTQTISSSRRLETARSRLPTAPYLCRVCAPRSAGNLRCRRTSSPASRPPADTAPYAVASSPRRAGRWSCPMPCTVGCPHFLSLLFRARVYLF